MTELQIPFVTALVNCSRNYLHIAHGLQVLVAVRAASSLKLGKHSYSIGG